MTTINIYVAKASEDNLSTTATSLQPGNSGRRPEMNTTVHEQGNITRPSSSEENDGDDSSQRAKKRKTIEVTYCMIHMMSNNVFKVLKQIWPKTIERLQGRFIRTAEKFPTCILAFHEDKIHFFLSGHVGRTAESHVPDGRQLGDLQSERLSRLYHMDCARDDHERIACHHVLFPVFYKWLPLLKLVEKRRWYWSLWELAIKDKDGYTNLLYTPLRNILMDANNALVRHDDPTTVEHEHADFVFFVFAWIRDPAFKSSIFDVICTVSASGMLYSCPLVSNIECKENGSAVMFVANATQHKDNLQGLILRGIPYFHRNYETNTRVVSADTTTWTLVMHSNRLVLQSPAELEDAFREQNSLTLWLSWTSQKITINKCIVY